MPARSAFTLFEVILAVALSTLLLALIGMAVQLFLTRIEARRSDVEYAQLARSIFSMISADLRGASEYRPQDLSGLMPVVATIPDVNQLADGATAGNSGGQQTGGLTGGQQLGGGTGGGAAGGSSGTGGAATSTGAGDTGQAADSNLPSYVTTPGIHGSLDEILIDTSQPPRPEELFTNRTGYANAVVQTPELPQGSAQVATSPLTVAALLAPKSDLRSVRYFVRPGTAIDPNNADLKSQEVQTTASGLVRQEIDRAKRVWAEQIGNSALLESGQVLLAPEVATIEFRYYDGLTVLDYWEMVEMGYTPNAVEVRLWLADPTVLATADEARVGTSGLLANAREYRQIIYLPTNTQPLSTGATETETTETGTGTTGSGATGAGARSGS